MSRVAVLTDLHISVTPRSIDTSARLAAALDHIRCHAGAVDLLVICGDLTHTGDAASYARLRAALASVPVPVQLLIGNHDTRETFCAAFPETATDPAGFVQSSRDLAGHRLIFLDTHRGPPYDYPLAHIGLLSLPRMDWLAAQLDTDLPSIVFMHHPPHLTGFVGMDAIRLENGRAFHDLIGQRGNVRHIVCGHVHRTISGSHRGTPFSVFKSLSGQQPLLFETTDTSLECDEPPAYGLIDISPDAIIVQTEDFGLSDLETLRQQARPASQWQTQG